MVASFLITAREGLEAALILGILLGYANRTGRQSQSRTIWLGTGIAILASLLLAGGVFFTVRKLEGRGEAILEGIAAFLAAGVLAYMVLWMRRESRGMKNSLQAQAEEAMRKGSVFALASLAFVAVFREGAETILYMAGVVKDSQSIAGLIGALAGLALAATLGVLVYRGSRLIKLSTFFNLTGMLLMVFAAGMIAQGTLEFQALGAFPGTVTLWDTSRFLSDTGHVGSVLRALFGYTAAPSLLQLIFYLSFWVVLGFYTLNQPDRQMSRQTVPQAEAR
ncbi:MAG: FTR1 family protein [Chloroflexi bacterium]|nr:FTR1 family protein [Chloroflexota bacterium]